MRAVVQRVSAASVRVDNEVISQIGKGLMVLVGIGTDDSLADVEYIAKKVLNIRVFDLPSADAGSSMWKSSVQDIQGEILCVSQFTLMANTTKGNKPDFHNAMAADLSEGLYGTFIDRIGKMYGAPDRIKDGKFGAMMSVSLSNEGPVTVVLDSRKFEYVAAKGGSKPQTSRSGSWYSEKPGPSQDAPYVAQEPLSSTQSFTKPL